MRIQAFFRKRHRIIGVSFALFLAVILTVQWLLPSYRGVTDAAKLSSRRVEVNNPLPSVITSYDFSFTIVTAGNLGSISFQFCGNDPIPSQPCVPPTGFDASSAILSSQSGETGFTIHPSSTANHIIVSRVPTNATIQTVDYLFDNITTPSVAGTSYVRVATYASDDATGPTTDEGGIAYPIVDALTVSSEVPQFLEFCVGVTITGYNCGAANGHTIDFGEFSTKKPSTGSSEFMAITNAPSGYNVSINGPPPTSGNDVIAAASGVSQAGKSQFGVNLRANSNPTIGTDPQGPGTATPIGAYGTTNQFQYHSGDVLVSSTTEDNYRKFTTSYIVNISGKQPPGVYATTMYFICLANF